MFQLPALIGGVSTMKDKGLKIVVYTQELSPSEKAEVFNLSDEPVWVAFKKTELKPEDIKAPEFVPDFKNDKSPSERLRSVLFVYFEQHRPAKDFDTFYRSKMEEIITAVKQKLN